jgi:sugar phosphate permease
LLRRWWRNSTFLWLTLGSFSLWSLRGEWATLRQYFTWTAVRYAVAYNRLAALGLGLCVGLTVALLSATGVVAGFYIIPLQSMLQSLSPDDSRGRVLGTANGMSFVMGGAGSVLFLVLRQAGMPSNRIFLALAAVCLAVGLAERLRLSRQPSLASSPP